MHINHWPLTLSTISLKGKVANLEKHSLSSLHVHLLDTFLKKFLKVYNSQKNMTLSLITSVISSQCDPFTLVMIIKMINDLSFKIFHC